MCGIAGILEHSGRPASEAELRGMATLLAHRGPDGEGVHIDRAMGLAFRRLAIIDLATGDQPMQSYNGRYWITFNGEIYNFLELRHELTQLGHRFRTNGDTEVILAAYEQWGEDCQHKLNGMWGFAIWDTHECSLFLSRDRFGVKPLHFYQDDQRFAFSSELKGFLALPWIDRQFDPNVLTLAVGNYPVIDATEHCLLKNVRRLRSGHSLTIRQGGTPQIKRWWRTLSHIQDVPRDSRMQSAMFRDLFLDACALRMRSDVPLGTALSGGLDSSAVHCAMVAANRGMASVTRRPADWQKAFVAGFSGTPQDETEHARTVTEFVGSQAILHEITAAEVIENLPNSVYAAESIHDLPSPAWLLYRTMSQHGIHVSLDGHGGDELFAGYHFHVQEVLKHAKSFGNRTALENTLRAMYAMDPRGVRQARVTTQQFLLGTPASVEFPELVEDNKVLDQFDPLSHRLYLDFHYFTLPNILQNFDRASMAHGVEIRAPFMDWRVVCMAHALPWTVKVRQGYSKYIVRAALNEIMPRSIVHRRTKVGLITPFEAWVGGPMREYILDSTSSRAFLDQPIWDGPGLRDAAEQAVAEADGPTARRIWPFIQANLLQQTFLQQHDAVRPANAVDYSSSTA
jgi:asparagine synthase (glutamine-hydrolysing)